MDLATIVSFAQVAVAIVLSTAILLQARGSSVGGAFGGSDAGTTFYTRRGAELILFRATFVLGVLFALLALAAHYL